VNLRALLAVPSLLVLAGLTVPAAAPVGQDTVCGSVVRYASMRSDEVNLRTGPGVRHPVDWVFTAKDLPVAVTAEYDNWRRICDWEGTIGWVHKAMLSGARTVVLTGELRTLRRDPTAQAPAVVRAEPGVVGELLRCDEGWCRLDVRGYRGWLARDEFWGVSPDEKAVE